MLMQEFHTKPSTFNSEPISLEITHRPAQYIWKVAQPNCIAREHVFIAYKFTYTYC